MKHGLTSQTVVIPGEDMQVYLALVKSFQNDLAPKGAVELHLCNSARQRLSRVFERTFKQFHELQAKRRETEEVQLEEAEMLMELHDAQFPNIGGLLYNPSDDGFVFSLKTVETSRDRRERKRHALAYAEGHEAAWNDVEN